MYQLQEMGFAEELSFFDNLRSMKFLLFGVVLATAVGVLLLLITKTVADHWVMMIILKRFFSYAAVNGIVRVLILEYSLVIFSGFVTM